MKERSPLRVRVTALAQHLALVVFGCFATFLLLESGLRVAAVIVQTVGYRAGERVDERDQVVLCVGDSHTYGAPLPREESYPSQLQQYLERVAPDRRWRVINRGIPGMNSAQVGAALEGWLLNDRPRIVVVWVGANNWWNREDPDGMHRTGRSSPGVLSRLRLYKLYLTFAAQSAVADWDAFSKDVLDGSSGWLLGEPVTPSERFRVTVTDLSHIATTITAHGVPWLLVSYPEPEYKWQRKAAEMVAAKQHVRVVRTTDDLERAKREYPDAQLLCPWPAPPDHDCLLVFAVGPHPTKLLYRFIAESIGNQILETLADPADDSRARP